MKSIQLLRTEIHASVEQQSSQKVLEYVYQILSGETVWTSEKEEAALTEGMEAIDKGDSISLEEFAAISAREREERRKKYS